MTSFLKKLTGFGSSNSQKTDTGSVTDRRLLIVDFVEARNLIPVEKSGKSEPLLKAWLFRPKPFKEVIGEKYSTIKNVGKTLDPQWNESFQYGQTYDLHSLIDIPLTLHVEICHKTLSAKMGFCEIPLETISGTVDQWYTLTKCSNMSSVSGEVHLRLRFQEPLPQAKPAASGSQDLSDEFTSEEDPLYASEKPNELHISVLQGKEMIAMNTGLFGDSLSDPLVKIKILGINYAPI